MNTLAPTYDSTTRLHSVTDPATGEILSARSQRDAARDYLAVHAPAILPLVDRMEKCAPQLRHRVYMAALLVAAQAVQPGRGTRALTQPWRTRATVMEVAQVAGNDRDSYSIINLGQGYACNCRDWQSNQAPIVAGLGQVCKHVLAYLITQKLAEEGQPHAA